ncbi:hypothetical protein MC885_003815 [Smutsia gigantea]|nr:hypothetical protein MC885_003815 [Smutsia gigantea]
MGSRARRGRGGSQARRQLGTPAPPRRRRGRCSRALARLPAPAAPLFAYGQTLLEQTELRPGPSPPFPGGFHHVAERVTKREAV